MLTRALKGERVDVDVAPMFIFLFRDGAKHQYSSVFRSDPLTITSFVTF